MRVLMDALPSIEADILRRRFGVDVADDETLEEIGRTHNLSRERVRQLQLQGLKRMQAWMQKAS